MVVVGVFSFAPFLCCRKGRQNESIKGIDGCVGGIYDVAALLNLNVHSDQVHRAARGLGKLMVLEIGHLSPEISDAKDDR